MGVQDNGDTRPFIKHVYMSLNIDSTLDLTLGVTLDPTLDSTLDSTLLVLRFVLLGFVSCCGCVSLRFDLISFRDVNSLSHNDCVETHIRSDRCTHRACWRHMCLRKQYKERRVALDCAATATVAAQQQPQPCIRSCGI